MKRVLVIRFFALEFLPMIAALALGAYSQRLMPAAFATAAVAIFTCVALSIREGVVLAKYGGVCERKKDRIGYWLYVGVHSFFGAFFLIGAALTFFHP